MFLKSFVLGVWLLGAFALSLLFVVPSLVLVLPPVPLQRTPLALAGTALEVL
ncbi:hypothetical protein L208DRAFT_1389911 [Tricholoma matsutake]|nr:hypothetical protein L208DRAFT_1389911 [Tricholoma matsutake 945]